VIVDGKYLPNITCRRCRWRHPAELTCAAAAQIAERDRAPEEPPRKTDRELIEDLIDRVERLEEIVLRGGQS
jgi:hypothetical protein